MINFLMGNFRWAARQIASLEGNVTEIGAGEGRLCTLLAGRFPRKTVTGIDLIPRPEGLGAAIQWKQGDLMEILHEPSGGILIGAMILHHFSSEQLRQLGALMGGFDTLCFCEPLRAPLSHLWGWALLPLVGRVTRHDMPVSIDAGFRAGELTNLLGLERESWEIREHGDFRGSLRWIARRK